MTLPFPTRRYSLWNASLELNHEFPTELWQVLRPPIEIYAKGSEAAFALFKRLPLDGFAVVGTRHPQVRSIQMLRSRIQALRNTPLVILSGLARGIDAAAHEEAIRAGLPTIAILGSSLENIYPPENEALALKILRAGGLIISEFAPQTPIQRHCFIQRNRLIAGWSKAVWVVEAGRRSGALNTAKWARDQDKDCYVTPCYPGDLALAGNQSLLNEEASSIAFWEPSTLGHTWGDLKSLGSIAKAKRTLSLSQSHQTGAENDADALAREVARRTFTHSGATVEEVLEWALALGWEPQRFFSALQGGLSEELIVDQNGILSALNMRSREGSFPF